MSEDNSINTSSVAGDLQIENGHGEFHNDMNYNEVNAESTLDNIFEAESWESELIEFVKARIENQYQLELESAKEAAVSTALDIAEKEFHNLLEQSRNEWDELNTEKLEESIQDRLKQACDEATAIARRDAEAQIEELLEQLEGSRNALTLAVASAQSATAQAAAFDLLRDAINDIDSKRTQSDTLSTLVEHSSKFAPRVAFFVVKSGNAIGWKAKGFENGLNDESVKSLNIPSQSENILNKALSAYSMIATESSSESHSNELLSIFGEYASDTPTKAIGFPLIVKGKAAAALYADSGDLSADAINISAIETLMRVAGMGVELLKPRSLGELYRPAVAQIAPPAPTQPDEVTPQTDSQTVNQEETSSGAEVARVQPEEQPQTQEKVTAEMREHAQHAEFAPQEFSMQSTPSVDDTPTSELPDPQNIETQVAEASNIQDFVEAIPEQQIYSIPNYEVESFATAAASPMGTASPGIREETADSFADYINRSGSDPVSPVNKFHTPPPVSEPVYDPVSQFEETTQTPSPASETEQRAHNDARRFARLLVSEIKLYNAAKVNEGRKNYDLYERLQEDIDRSRKVYDKRVSPSVAARFDYFYDELVQTLAEGDSAKLGPGCPGPFVLAS